MLQEQSVAAFVSQPLNLVVGATNLLQTVTANFTTTQTFLRFGECGWLHKAETWQDSACGPIDASDLSFRLIQKQASSRVDRRCKSVLLAANIEWLSVPSNPKEKLMCENNTSTCQ